MHLQHQALGLRQAAHHRFHLTQQRRQGQRVVLQADPAGLHAGDVQDVVQHRQQVLGGVPGGVHEAALFGVQPGIVEQAQHAQQAVERGAQLVAHVGQEDGLGLVGLVGRGAGFAQMLGQGLQLAALPVGRAPLGHHQRRKGQGHQAQAGGQPQAHLDLVADGLGAAVGLLHHQPAAQQRQQVDGLGQVLQFLPQQGQLPGVGQAGLGQHRVGPLHKGQQARMDAGVVVWCGQYRADAGRLHQVDPADEDLVALRQRLQLRRCGRLDALTQRFTQVQGFGFQLEQAPDDVVVREARSATQQAQLLPLGPGHGHQAGDQHQADQRDGPAAAGGQGPHQALRQQAHETSS